MKRVSQGNFLFDHSSRIFRVPSLSSVASPERLVEDLVGATEPRLLELPPSELFSRAISEAIVDLAGFAAFFSEFFLVLGNHLLWDLLAKGEFFHKQEREQHGTVSSLRLSWP